ncbi:MAG: TIGR03619 family F420-dependent LLM class oxidoreductase [Ilumatobacteraceae bacterium]
MIPNVGLNIVAVVGRRVADAARAGEDLGFDSLWIGEHVVTPLRFDDTGYPGGVGRQPFDSFSPFLDPLAVLAHAAAVTTEVKLGTGVLILPLRDPHLTARSITSLDQMSGGRAIIGVGVGWMPEEFSVLRRSYEERGRVTDEFLAVLDMLWSGSPAAYDGRAFAFPPLAFEPRPVQQPRPPTLVGGSSPPALERAARYDGWYGSADAASLPRIVATITAHREAAGLDGPPSDISVICKRPSRAELEALGAAGATRVVVNPWGDTDGKHVGTSDSIEPVREFARSVGLG